MVEIPYLVDSNILLRWVKPDHLDYEMGTVTVLAVLTHKDYEKGGWKSACNC